MESKRILIAGEGGQGVQALANILAFAAFENKKQVSYMPNFGVEQRGGVSLAFVQISDEEISFPKFQKADYVVLFASRAIKRIEEYLDKETVLMFDNSLIAETDLANLKLTKIGIPATNLAEKKLIPRVFNILMLGALTAELGSPAPKKMEQEIEKFFVEKFKKEPELRHFNMAAFRQGYEIVENLKKDSKWREKILKK